ncbi:MAG: glycosyl hydrolase [Verrucomicrobia bacterium]|nr:glycosyl hydrolase [Verrucomicrobiota bacterium]
MSTGKIPTNTLILALVGGSWATATAAEDKLYEAFQNPPAEARPFVRWWWNGDCVTEKEILRELDLMQAAGIGGVEINPVAMPGGATPSTTEPLIWLSPEWNRMAGIATRGAKDRGMLADMIVGSGWPFGGRFLKSGETIQAIGVTRMTLKGPGVFKGELKELMKPPAPRVVAADAAEPRLMYLRLVPKNATCIDGCLDVADQIKPDGSVEFEIPAGEHTLHIGTWQEAFTAVVHGAPGSDGQVLNHLNQAAVAGYLQRMSDQLGPALGGKLGDGLRAMFCDSIELSGANWTTDFPEEFLRRRGYRLEPWYPFALYDPHQGYRDLLPDDAQFADAVRRVRYDFNKTFVELFHERFIRVFHAWCHANGVLSRYQAYGGPSLMDMLSGYLIPDIPEGDNWIFHPPGNQLPLNQIRYAVWNKYAASAAHLTGKKLVSCEAMTNLRGVFQATLEYIKLAGDLDMMTGVNHLVLHGFNYSPPEAGFPGWVRYGTYFNEHNPWWPHFRKWADYNARLCSVLQASQARAEVAILGPTADVWSNGGLERQAFIHTPWYLHLVWQALQQNGCTADYVNGAVLRNATFKDGRILHGPMAYDLLLVANVESLEPATARTIEQYAKAGGKIAFVGNTPDRSAGLQNREACDQAVREAMAAAIKTGSRQVSVIAEPGQDELLQWATATLARFDVRPAVRIAVPHPMLFQVHQQRNGREIFLFSNQQQDQPISFHGSFATGDLTPWRWNPETGERSVFPHGVKCNELDITLEPLASLLLVFEPAMPGTAMPPAPLDRSDAIEIKPPWRLTLKPAIGETVSMDLKQLEDLGLAEHKTLNTFAGTAVYRVRFEVADATASILSLGSVHGISEVTLNGKALGVRWWGAEHLYDPQGTLRQGDNELEVQVTTVLSNYCRTLKDNKMAMNWASEHEQVSTGLVGPVMLYRKTHAAKNKLK